MTRVTWKTKIQNHVRAWVADESGQSTTEYVLLLLFVVVAVKAAGGQLKTKIQGILDAAFGKADTAIQQSNTE